MPGKIASKESARLTELRSAVFYSAKAIAAHRDQTGKSNSQLEEKASSAFSQYLQTLYVERTREAAKRRQAAETDHSADGFAELGLNF